IAELHNHLKGSSLIFTLNWLAVMNFPRKYGKRQFKDMKNFKGDYWEITLAAFLRAWLYKEIYAIQDTPMDKIFKQFLKEKDKSVFVQFNIADVQEFISRLRYRNGADVDYAIPSHLPISTKDVDSRTCMIGERQLLYKCFNGINRCEKSQLFQTLFYAYLIVKAKFRYAMVQINDVIGFANFSYYDSKKSNLLKALENIPVYKNKLVEIGVKLAVQKSCVKHIEYRITPEDTASELQKELNKADKHTNSGDSHGYIVHFIKKKDKNTGKGKVEEGTICRNYEERKKYSREADGVRTLLINGNRQITGIDAANSEFFCRPEVFGTVFRKVRHTQPKTDMAYFKELPPLNLGVTYHVGEDFYDIIDGLRAMEEAVIFLNLRNGDRIGHGTALGLDVRHYYEEKHYTVVMPKQVMLDNMVWLLDKIEKYGIDGGTFLHEAKKEFYRLREEIYHTHLEEQTFMDAWLLRGDEPSLYLDATHEPKRQNLMDIYQLNMDNKVVPARSDEDARKLYYRYHYDYKVKAEGAKSKEWKIETEHRESFVRILETIQEKMQEEIARRHIAIECNPTSNLRIGNIPRYVEHPIVKFNNEDLIRTDGKVDKSAQISVSINTDDAGIFATSLEKEFTLMALALEKETTEDGEPKYQQRSVYRWLENVRENAFIQKFGEEK
ncbi:MAG: hypothetical protein MJ009_07295, partial [Paludibacteraceae bacterium]|nr:hypothetical protein [Paludibacteraceae bacterium]